MDEGRHVVVGDVILRGAATIDPIENDRTIKARTQGEMLETLVREHSRLVYRIAYAVLRRHHDA